MPTCSKMCVPMKIWDKKELSDFCIYFFFGGGGGCKGKHPRSSSSSLAFYSDRGVVFFG